MVCENCKLKPATSFFQYEENGKKVEKYLCSECRKTFSVPEIQKPQTAFVQKRTCSNCGTSLNDFLESSYLGCEKCYEDFLPIVMQALANVQAGFEHVGKFPDRFLKHQRILELEKLLDCAINNKDLEQVNRISKEIKDLKQGGERE